ncbi:MAG TPA: hypothetical protein VGW57_07485 [Chthoniobacterales bacterium]|nr:hypothetical protein [Chthoniobacterales bacterium]
MTSSDLGRIPPDSSFRLNGAPVQPPPTLPPEDKLAVLQANDLRRKWHSLDDQRVCVLCDRIITGREVEVRRDPNGTLSVHCPTHDCPSVPSDWFYQGNSCSGSRPVHGRTREASIWNS